MILILAAHAGAAVAGYMVHRKRYGVATFFALQALGSWMVAAA